MNKNFTIKFDNRTKSVLVQALIDAQTKAAALVINSDYDKETLLHAEEIAAVLRGVLLTKPDSAPDSAQVESEETGAVDLTEE